MGFLSGIGDILNKFSGTNANTTPGNAEETGAQFEQVAKAVPCSSVASGLAEAFRSGNTPPFSQMASQLFSNGDGAQKATMLTALLSAAGPSLLSKLGGSSPALASLLQSGQTSVTPEQAAKVDPQQVQALAEHVHQADPSIIDKVSQIYAEHPTLVKTLGAAAMAIAMKKIAEHHQG